MNGISLAEEYFISGESFVIWNVKKNCVIFCLFCTVFGKKRKTGRRQNIFVEINIVRKTPSTPWFYSKNYCFDVVDSDGFLTKAWRWTNGTEKNGKWWHCWQYCINPVLFTVRYVLYFVHAAEKLVFFQKEGVRDKCSRQKEHTGRSKWLFFDKKYNR